MSVNRKDPSVRLDLLLFGGILRDNFFSELSILPLSGKV